MTAAGLSVGGVLAVCGYRERQRWYAALDLLHDPAFAFPMVRAKGSWLPLDMYKGQQEALGMSFTQDDIIVASFPKSGTTWLQEIVFLLMHDLNVIKAGASTMEERFPYLEYVFPGPSALSQRPPPRLLKTHLPAVLLPPSALAHARILYIARDPKDVLVSYFHFARMFAPAGYEGSPADFKERFLHSQRLPYAPWTVHVSGYRELAERSADRVLVLTYEELSRSPHRCVRRIAAFLGKADGLSERAVADVVEHCSFERMRRNPAANYGWWDRLGLRKGGPNCAEFMREGRVGGWKAMLSEEEAAEVDRGVRAAGLSGLWPREG